MQVYISCFRSINIIDQTNNNVA